MSKTIKVMVLSGYGLNCEEETALAFQLAGGQTDIMHINDLIKTPSRFNKYQIIAIPGGFSYGDDTGSGNAYAHKVKNHLADQLFRFIGRDTLMIGICNGCQICTNLGLVPGLSGKTGTIEAVWTHNDNNRYTVRWIDLKIQGPSPWLTNISNISLPIAHGEGKLYLTHEILSRIEEKKLDAAKYCKGEMCQYLDLPANPTGTLHNIAALTDPTGKILAMMPHPERAIFFQQLPHWTFLKEKLQREGKKVPVHGPGLQIFKNAISYFSGK